jgi:WD40 repeat protein
MTTEEKTLVISMVFSLGGDLLFAGIEKLEEENNLQVFRVADGSVLWQFEGHEDRITSVAINAEGTQLASGDSSGMIILWGLPEN